MRYETLEDLTMFYENHHDMRRTGIVWKSSDVRCFPHFHNSIELLYVLEGEVHTEIDGDARIIHPGEMGICSSFMLHSYRDLSPVTALIGVFPLGALPSVQKTLQKHAFNARFLRDNACGEFRLIMEMFLDFKDSENDILRKGLSYMLLGLLIERVGLTRTSASEQTQMVRDVLIYLEAHLSEPLSVDQVAQAFGYSKSRFSHLFNERVKCTMPAYVRQLRCNEAARLLKETDQSVLEIALRTGFDCPQTFYRAFKTSFGMTPMTYKRMTYGKMR